MEWGPIIPDIDERPALVADWDKVMLLDADKMPLPLGDSGWYAKGAPWGNLAIKFIRLKAGHPFYSAVPSTQPTQNPSTGNPVTHVTLIHADGSTITMAVPKG